MRLTLLLAASSAIAMTAAAAQNAPPAEPPAKAEEPAPGLSDLRDTVQGLEDETAGPAEPAPDAGTPPPPPPPPAPPPPAPAPPPPASTAAAPPLTRAQRAELEAAVVRGRLIGAIARAGILATQDMLSRISDPEGAGLAGWIAEPEGNGVSVTFYASPASGPVAVYRVNIMGGRVQGREIFLAADRPPLNPIEARMARARAAAEGQDHRPCGGDQFNVFVVPPSAPDTPIDVYQVSPQSRHGHFPLGGHFKTTVAPDGSIAATRGYTNVCLDAAVADPAPGARPAPIAITHLLDPLPTEIHVFLSMWTGHPLVVVAGDPQRLFAVTPQGIAEVPR